MQEYWRQKGAHSCFCTIQDIHEFFEWLANRLVHLKSGQKAFVKAQQYVANLAKFQGSAGTTDRTTTCTASRCPCSADKVS